MSSQKRTKWVDEIIRLSLYSKRTLWYDDFQKRFTGIEP